MRINSVPTKYFPAKTFRSGTVCEKLTSPINAFFNHWSIMNETFSNSSINIFNLLLCLSLIHSLLYIQVTNCEVFLVYCDTWFASLGLYLLAVCIARRTPVAPKGCPRERDPPQLFNLSMAMWPTLDLRFMTFCNTWIEV